MAQPLGVFEDIHTAPRRKLFTLWGVRWLATTTAWLSVPLFLAAGIVLALLGGDSFGHGLALGAAIFVANVVHSFGHILSGKAVGAPMHANLVTATRHINLYTGPQEGLPARVHLGRALGGPLTNLIVGLLALILHFSAGGTLLRTFGMVNVVIGVGAFAPIPSADGEVIWRELRRLWV